LLKSFHPKEFKASLEKKKKIIEIDIDAILANRERFPNKTKYEIFREFYDKIFQKKSEKLLKKLQEDLIAEYDHKMKTLDATISN
jgi:hypothetical protein